MPPSKPVSKEDTELKDPDSKAAKKKAKEAGKAGGAENPAAWAISGTARLVVSIRSGLTRGLRIPRNSKSWVA